MPLDAPTLPHHYFDREIFEQEQAKIFASGWTFAGLRNELPSDNDYHLTEVASIGTIVQNCGGTIRAFRNACSHRHARILEAERGNRRLVCPYHGWTYDQRGVPERMAAEIQFPQVLENRDKYALEQFEVACAGHFIFVRRDRTGPSLPDALGSTHEFLEKVSIGLDEKMDEFREGISANWKVVIENALEGYHVPFVHRATLGAIRQFSKKPTDVVDHLPAENGHSYMVNQASPEWLGRWLRFESELGSWPFKFNHYVHQLVFPNLTVTSFMGYSFHIQQFHPVSPSETVVDSRIYSVKCEGQSEKGRAIMRSVYDEGRAFTRKVFGEDRRVCELVQNGIRHATKHAVLANHLEKRIAHFQKSYLRALSQSGSA